MAGTSSFPPHSLIGQNVAANKLHRFLPPCRVLTMNPVSNSSVCALCNWSRDRHPRSFINDHAAEKSPLFLPLKLAHMSISNFVARGDNFANFGCRMTWCGNAM